MLEDPSGRPAALAVAVSGARPGCSARTAAMVVDGAAPGRPRRLVDEPRHLPPDAHLLETSASVSSAGRPGGLGRLDGLGWRIRHGAPAPARAPLGRGRFLALPRQRRPVRRSVVERDRPTVLTSIRHVPRRADRPRDRRGRARPGRSRPGAAPARGRAAAPPPRLDRRRRRFLALAPRRAFRCAERAHLPLRTSSAGHGLAGASRSTSALRSDGAVRRGAHGAVRCAWSPRSPVLVAAGAGALLAPWALWRPGAC